MPPTTPDPDIFRPNRDALDGEWVEQPRLYYEWAAKLAEARSEYERTKADLKLVEAELDRDIRRDPESFGHAKITETLVERTIQLQRAYRRAHDLMLQAKHTAEQLEAAVTALDHRKRALEGLVQLWLASYFAAPRVQGEAGARQREMEASAVFGGVSRRKARDKD